MKGKNSRLMISDRIKTYQKAQNLHIVSKIKQEKSRLVAEGRREGEKNMNEREGKV